MQAAFTAGEIAQLRTEHLQTLTMRCDVLRGTAYTQSGAYTEDGPVEPHGVDVRCTFMRSFPGYRRNEPDRDQVTAEPTLVLAWDADVQIKDRIANIREEHGATLVRLLEVKTVTQGQFSTVAVLREVTVANG